MLNENAPLLTVGAFHFFVEVTCKPEKTKNLFKRIDGRQICF